LIRDTVGVVVILCLTEFLPKLGEASFARSCSLANPLVSVESSRLRHRPKQHPDNQSGSQHVIISLASAAPRLRLDIRNASNPTGWLMCDLYSITTNQAAIIALFRVVDRGRIKCCRWKRGAGTELHPSFRLA
jgi:hypothetical protein